MCLDICWASLDVSLDEGAHFVGLGCSCLYMYMLSPVEFFSTGNLNSYVFGACYFVQGLVVQLVPGGDLISFSW